MQEDILATGWFGSSVLPLGSLLRRLGLQLPEASGDHKNSQSPDLVFPHPNKNGFRNIFNQSTLALPFPAPTSAFWLFRYQALRSRTIFCCKPWEKLWELFGTGEPFLAGTSTACCWSFLSLWGSFQLAPQAWLFTSCSYYQVVSCTTDSTFASLWPRVQDPIRLAR